MTRQRDPHEPERLRDLDPELARVFDATDEPQLSAAQVDQLAGAFDRSSVAPPQPKLAAPRVLALKLGAGAIIGAAALLLARLASPPQAHETPAVAPPPAAETALRPDESGVAKKASQDARDAQAHAPPSTTGLGPSADIASQPPAAGGAPQLEKRAEAELSAAELAAQTRRGSARAAAQRAQQETEPPEVSAPADLRSTQPRAPKTPPTAARAPSNATRGAATAPEPAAARQNPAGAAENANRSQHDKVPVAGPASELLLLERAQRALKSSPREALALTDEHKQLYPHGRFAEEREQVAIEALARVGAGSALAARAHQFLETYPRSAYAARVLALVKAQESHP